MKHKKRTYRKEQPKETLVVWDILKNETVAFLDTEYVTTQQKHDARRSWYLLEW